jgi:hypothetical protein
MNLFHECLHYGAITTLDNLLCQCYKLKTGHKNITYGHPITPKTGNFRAIWWGGGWNYV